MNDLGIYILFGTIAAFATVVVVIDWLGHRHDNRTVTDLHQPIQIPVRRREQTSRDSPQEQR